MKTKPALTMLAAGVALLAVTACGRGDMAERVGGNPDSPERRGTSGRTVESESSIWDIFRPQRNENIVAVNKYIWNGALDVLDFLPVQAVDPFTGVITTGYGTPPGGGRAYRATVYISDPALDARSLKLALQTRDGRPVDVGTQRAVEDAILARARQLRSEDSRF
ncbi:MAG: DUF3576 domain-containing protein [Paracoccaceae bacterium]